MILTALTQQLSSSSLLSTIIKLFSEIYTSIAKLGDIIIINLIYNTMMKTINFFWLSKNVKSSYLYDAATTTTILPRPLVGHSCNSVTNFIVGFVFLYMVFFMFLFPRLSFAFKSSNRNHPYNTNNHKETSNKYFDSTITTTTKTRTTFQRQFHHRTNVDAPSNSQNDRFTSNLTAHNATATTTRPAPPQSQSQSSLSTSIHSVKNVLNEVSAMFEERHAYVRKVLEEFSQPFVGLTRMNSNRDCGNDNDVDDNVNNHDDHDYDDMDHLETIIVQGSLLLNDYDTNKEEEEEVGIKIDNQNEKISNVCTPPIHISKCSSNSNGNNNGQSNDNQITHFCFLVHGYRGKPADLRYLRSAMANNAEEIFYQSQQRHEEEQKQQEKAEEEEQQQNHITVTTDSSTEMNQKKKMNNMPTSSNVSDDNDNNNKSDSSTSRSTENKKQHKIVLHSCQSNWNNTSDGVEAGGERIFQEILHVIKSSMSSSNNDNSSNNNNKNNIKGEVEVIQDVTISIIGNSLGGLYSRYAIARLAAFSNNDDDKQDDGKDYVKNDRDQCDEKNIQFKPFLIDGNIRIHFNTFCSTATPHLGVSGHTYLPLPRTAEVGIGSLMGQTGKDIFRMSPLIKSMCTNEAYLKPLGLFRKRIAYANGYHTDFVVSTQSAAFLHPESTTPHHLSSSMDDQFAGEDGGRVIESASSKNGIVVATLYTEATDQSNLNNKNNTSSSSRSNIEGEGMSQNNTKKKKVGIKLTKQLKKGKYSSVKEELLEMSAALDQLGWKKVIVDLRNEMPMKLPLLRKPKIPSNIFPRIVKKWSTDVSESSLNDSLDRNGGDRDSSEFELDSCSPSEGGRPSSPSNKLVLESRDVANTYSIPDDFIGFPLGHNTMVAVANSRLTFVFKGGRPLMDDLAKEMIHEILSFDA